MCYTLCLLLELTEEQSDSLPSVPRRRRRQSSALFGRYSADARFRSSLSPSPDLSRRNSGIIVRSCSSVCLRVSIDMVICLIHLVSLLILDEHVAPISLDCQHSNRSGVFFVVCLSITLLGSGFLVELFSSSLDYHRRGSLQLFSSRCRIHATA